MPFYLPENMKLFCRNEYFGGCASLEQLNNLDQNGNSKEKKMVS